MSSIPTKQIDGDVSIGRDVSIGGKATVRGSATIGHNLTVEGWLEAKNIKGPNKGLFKTAGSLREAYPSPHEGWWALVAVEGSASSDHLGQLYVADGGVWVAQVDSDGNPLLKGNPTIDSTEYLEAVEEMTSDIKAVKEDVNQNKEDIKSLRSNQTSGTNTLNTLSSQMNATQSDISLLKESVSELSAFEGTKGAADGLAPLDENGQVPSQYLPGYVDDVLEFGGVLSGITAQLSKLGCKSTDDGCQVVYNSSVNVFVIAHTTVDTEGGSSTIYYYDWVDADLFGGSSEKGRTPHSGKIFMDVSSNKTYRWSGTTLAVIGSDLALGYTSGTAYPGNDGKNLDARLMYVENEICANRELIDKNAEEVSFRNTINANTLLSLGERQVSFSVVLEKMFDLDNASSYMKPGIVLSFVSDTGMQNKQWTNYGAKGESDWKTESNWTDFGSNGSAIGNTVNVNDICDDVEYTLSTAIKAVQDKEKESGLTYMKSGVVLTYKTAETTGNGSPKWEAYQFTRAVEDINPADLKPWVEFGGGGGSTVTTSDSPEKGGQEAFSTGGAYANIPTNLRIDTETQGVVKLQLENAEKEAVGDEVQFAVGGGGESTGTIVSIQFEQSPLYAKAGGGVVMKASIRSITTLGSVEQDNAIAECLLKDRDTGQTLETFQLNRKSSASADTYDFAFDVSSYFVTATSKRFQLVAYDDAGNTGSRNINVSGVDVTITSVQTLNYTSSTALAVGGASKNLPMYKFANNASDKGIKVTTEIYLNGEWQILGTSVVTDTYSHSISIDPKNCLGEVLSHGAYSLRIHGEDVGSGVVGNYLHTAVMVIEAENVSPIVVSRWYTEGVSGTRKLYENIEIDYAVYESDTDEPEVSVYYDGGQESNAVCYRTQTSSYVKQVLEGAHDGTKTVGVKFVCGGVSSQVSEYVIDGSLVDVEEVTDQREFNIVMDSRNNTETDKTMKDGDVSIRVTGCNWSSNGFVKDSYGTSTYGTEQDTGRMALRIAEDMTAVCDYQPFGKTSIEQNGMALSFTVRVKNVEDRTARLIDCLLGHNLGFYLTGEKLVFTCDGVSATDPDDLGAQQTAVALYRTDKETRFDIVVEPSSLAPYSGIGAIKIYVNGDEAAATHYTAGKFETSDATIQFDGTKADLYLYRITGWSTYYNFRQAFNNYLVGLKDTSEMLSEYEKNDVMASQTAEGTTKDRPTLSACMNAGLCTVTLLKNANTDDIEQNYPGYLDGLDGDKKTKVYLDVVVRFPSTPWQDFKAYSVAVTNQGTTSSMRPVKNKKLKFKGCTMELLHTAEDYKDDAEALAKFKECEKNAKKSKIRVIDGGLWVKTITVKVDYSDSTGANNGATMELMNKTQRAMGSEYMTPSQVFYNGSGTMDTSVNSISAALFRTDKSSADATNETYAYFHAKANFGVDKGNPEFFGFENAGGYNDGCLNYGDFVELVAAEGQTLSAYKDEVLENPDALIASNIYMLSEYCGAGHVFVENDGTGHMVETTAVADATAIDKTLEEVTADSVANYDWGTVYATSDGRYAKYVGGVWKDTTGEMTYDAATKKWAVSGRVLNPVECFEYLKYDSFCWLQGVNSAADLMALDGDGKPIWLQYYESRYPDDDDLNGLYEKGKKVPYNLYKWLEWAQGCNHDLDETAGDITLHGESVSGTKENRLKKWSEELWEHANVYSTGCYVVASDYVLAVDQRSKNMMIGFYLDTTGKTRAYFNHWYDGDCTWLADNDCGLTVPWDLDSAEDPKHYYQGWNSVMFKQSYAADKFWTSADGASTVSLHDIAKDMRSAEADGIKIFSAEGCEKLWITDRISKYAKVISSFDGERKYIENSKDGANYFYAVHGLRQEDLPETFSKRFAFRDGYYQVGDLYNNPFKMRAVGTDISIKITASQDGFFGLGVDRADTCTDSCYLKCGESYTLKSGVTASGSGTMLYVFGASKLASLDLSGCTPKAEGWDISTCTLLQELILGGEDYVPVEGSGAITQLNLGQKSFLRTLDVRNTKLTRITATYCPRLKEVLAGGSALTNIDLAETSPLTTLQLPGTMQTLYFKNLPKLTYPGGLTIEGMSNVKKLFVDGCANLDVMTLLNGVTTAGQLKSVRLPDVNGSGSVEILNAIKDNGAVGIDANGSNYDEQGQCSGIIGRWILAELIEDCEVEELQAYFPKLKIYNSQYSYVTFDDAENDSQNITNPENGTIGEDYVATGHFKRIEQDCHVYKCTYDASDAADPKMVCEQVDDSDYGLMADASEYDPSDNAGMGYDIMKLLVSYWYKGVNDYKNQKKHFFVSSLTDEPLSSATQCQRIKLGNCLKQGLACVNVNTLKVGNACVMQANAYYNCYEVNVDGMKQVRWPGVNSGIVGAAFVDDEDKVVGTFNMSVSHALFDFVVGDYVFCDVPKGAKRFVFTSPTGFDELECIAVDSDALEAIEPDWVHTRERLVGVYGLSMDTLMQPRSISGQVVTRGDGTSATNTDWTYDNTGKLTNTTVPTSKMHYTMKDLMNLCEMRGSGFQAIDYEMSKDIANLAMALVGDRDIQAQCGYGCQPGYTTGSNGANAYGNVTRIGILTGNLGNIIMGLQNFVGCCYEWMDNVAVNVTSYASFKKNKCVEKTTDPIDGQWHIYDPVTGEERVVQGLTQSGYCIARVKFGRYADVIASRVSSDNSKFNEYYADRHEYSGSKGRVVGRANYYGISSGGLVYANAIGASSLSSSNSGSRLAFSGKIVITK